MCGRFDSRVKAMEVDERPTEQYSDIGGLDKQIQEVRHQPSVRLELPGPRVNKSQIRVTWAPCQ